MVIDEHKILVVEDDSILRHQLVRALGKYGYTLVEAADGMDAIHILDSQEIHLVVTDLRMPFVHGISLLKYIKIFFSHIPVVVATAYPGDIEDLQPDALLCKPFSMDALIASVQRLIWNLDN